MSDRFSPVTMQDFCSWMRCELDQAGALFGIPRAHFFNATQHPRLTAAAYGQPLDTPFGVAAGPHSQMAQNLIVAWLCGARFLELKTVQTLDELEIPKPCIDAPDEGYNVEWSQELKIQESFEEYARAWVLIHALQAELFGDAAPTQTVFNISVGYNLEGIQKPNVQHFLDLMNNGREQLDTLIELAAPFFPALNNIDIPDRLSDTVTLSTMHGCPPDEIGRIAAYLIEERGLHTSVKLNPTLLGPDRLRKLLNGRMGFKHIEVPDVAFEHDLKYADGMNLLHDLQGRADTKGVEFGVKLSNTLEVINRRPDFKDGGEHAYLSGRPLQVLTVNLAADIAKEFDGKLRMSYAGGADAFNVANLLRSGMETVTVCTDILKPGGYMRMLQYVEETEHALDECDAHSLSELAQTGNGPLANLLTYAGDLPEDARYHGNPFRPEPCKTTRVLDLFDCIEAPCTDRCPISQRVPEYMNAVREGRFEDAIEITREDNPMPTVLGQACNHPCEPVCIRTHYDHPLAIREMKRFIMEQEKQPHYRKQAPARDTRVAIIGGGPCGLSAAYFLGQAGYTPTLFEAHPYAGGMVSGTIPGYRSTGEAISQDMEILQALGLEIKYGQKAGTAFTLDDLRKDGFSYIIIAAGAQGEQSLGLEGEDHPNVLSALDFLRDAREGHPPTLSGKVGVIGGGDVAMDCARTAGRLTGEKIQVIYRRTMDQMPAEHEEIRGLLEEGHQLIELAAPKELLFEDGKLTGLRCARMRLGEPGADGRRQPIEVPGAVTDIPLDHLIMAIGQKPKFPFLKEGEPDRTRKGYLQVDGLTMETSVPGLFAGGDAASDGPSTIVAAFGDGRAIAQEIRRREEGHEELVRVTDKQVDPELLLRRSRRVPRVHIPERALDQREGFDVIVDSMDEATAQREAARCLDCHKVCSLCVSVCPNKAFITYACEPFEAVIPSFSATEKGITQTPGTTLRIQQGLQVAVVTDFCNECGNCATFCPTSGHPYKDKPRIYLNAEEFAGESDNAFRLFRQDENLGIEGRFEGHTHRLVRASDQFIYEGPACKAVLEHEAFAFRSVDLSTADPVTPVESAILMFLFNSLSTSASYLPVM